MGRYIGIRVTTKKIFYTTLIDGNYFNEVIIIPTILPTPRQLSYIRTVLQSVITEQGIRIAGLRLGEGIANVSKERIYIEGVIQEFFANSSIEKYSILRLQSIAKKNNYTNDEIKGFIEGKELLPGIEGWKKFAKEHRESFLVVSSLEDGV